MQSIGYSDFDINSNVTHKNDIDYMKYYNRNSLDLINTYYNEDFINFNYIMI
jgi:hypothetical protein